jgi:hypothetical protein
MSWRLAFCCLALCGCPDDPDFGNGDMAALDASGIDFGPEPDGGVPVRAEFSIIGCASLKIVGEDPECQGPAPLRVTFVPLASGATTFVWTFTGGDPAQSLAINPSVLYARPGSYAVQLAAGGPGGIITAAGKIIVTAGGAGAPCSEDSDCDEPAGLTCLCGAGESCVGALASGLCTRSCDGASCAGGEVCADLKRGYSAPFSLGDGGVGDGGVSQMPQPWREPICLPGCTTSDDCRPGLICRELPALPPLGLSGGDYSWRRACFADVLGDVGDACAAASGASDPASCLSGRCDPFGARGLCTSPCDDVACPSTAACASLKAAPSDPLCLARCDAAHPCTDPLLSCETPGQPGSFGFTVPAGEPMGTRYCAPRRCDLDPASCGASGHCVPMSGASYCVRN